MKIYRSLEDVPKINRPVVTIGTFDGVHLGHQKILERITRIAGSSGGETVLITFWPHPRMVLFPEEHGVRLLNTFDEKTRLLASFGVDHLVRIPFTRAFSEMPSEDFIRSVLVEKIQTSILVIGYDHRFGKDREGSFAHLKARQAEYNFELEEIPREDIDNVGISSTKIREALEAGDITSANEFLGRAYTLEGTVVEGDKIGRTIGFPTANIQVAEPDKLIPMDGAYIVQVRLGNKLLDGILNIGKRPTVSGGTKKIEVNLLDFDGILYGESLEVAFLEFLRPEKKFGNLDELKEQLEKDRQQALAFFGTAKNRGNDN
ncbi:bifunctional riboflavin kinase/FAD synthetase [Cyclobacterium xiamenense]|uniref:bifunctional riboflavin kinase/FAD synthetase n=1 Tax=Cyclobacterium xiamenense TaxID=1297121 RepID=UPI0035D114E5